MKAADQQEEEHGLGLLEEAERITRKGWELLANAESDGENRGAIVAFTRHVKASPAQTIAITMSRKPCPSRQTNSSGDSSCTFYRVGSTVFCSA